MFSLLHKELRLAAHPNLFIFTLLGALVIVPAYPYGMVFLFGCLGPFVTFTYGRETNDLYFTALLPVSKADVVKSKLLMVVLAQMAQVLISIPFAFLRVGLLPEGNPAGIEANLAYYGFGFMIYAVFNFIFLTEFFRTAYIPGIAFLWAMIPAVIGVLAMEGLIHVPSLAWLDSVAPQDLRRQLPILLVGMLIYAAAMPAAYRVSATRFEKVDL